jgi:hypothetical protein
MATESAHIQIKKEHVENRYQKSRIETGENWDKIFVREAQKISLHFFRSGHSVSHVLL